MLYFLCYISYVLLRQYNIFFQKNNYVSLKLNVLFKLHKLIRENKKQKKYLFIIMLCKIE